MKAVTEAIRLQAAYAVEFQHIADEQQKLRERSLNVLRKELQSLLDFQEQFSRHCEKLYEDFLDGLLSKESYARQKAALLERRESACQRENEIRGRIEEIDTDNNRYVEKYSRYSELDVLTADISSDLLDRVTIWPDGRLEITLNYLDESPLMFDRKSQHLPV